MTGTRVQTQLSAVSMSAVSVSDQQLNQEFWCLAMAEELAALNEEYEKFKNQYPDIGNYFQFLYAWNAGRDYSNAHQPTFEEITGIPCDCKPPQLIHTCHIRPLEVDEPLYDYVEKKPKDKSFPWDSFFEYLPFLTVMVIIFVLLFWEKL